MLPHSDQSACAFVGGNEIRLHSLNSFQSAQVRDKPLTGVVTQVAPTAYKMLLRKITEVLVKHPESDEVTCAAKP